MGSSHFSLFSCSVMIATTLGGIYRHKASNKVRGGVSFPRDQTLPEFGEAAVGHHSQRCMDFLQKTGSHSYHTPSSAINRVTLSMRWRGNGKWNITLCMCSRVSSSDLDVSSFFIPVLDSGYTAVLFLQTGHGAFYECDTGGRN